MGRHVVWAAALAAVVLAPVPALAQTREVTGRVTRAVGGAPVPEASISEVGGRGVARTNPDGRFTITVGAGDVRLQVRAIGYRRAEVAVAGGQSDIAITLQEDPFKLEEVVTTGQATTLEKRAATTAVASVSSEEIVRAPSQAVEQALQGKVLGATISMNSGSPGGGGQVQIRGVTSILGNGQPLFVVDGVIIDNSQISSGSNTVQGAAGRTAATGIGSSQDALVNRLADLNPNEIESVEVLKSAAATAIYGSRATNGVVVIRTKRGSQGAPRFNLSGRVGTQDAYRLLGTRQFETVQEIIDLPYGNGADGAAVLNQLYPSGNIPFTRDYLQEFYDNRTPAFEVNANYGGGTASTQWFVTATQRREQGTAPNTGASLSTLRLNVDQAFGSAWRFSAGANITRNLLNRGLSNNDNTCTSPVYCFAYTPGAVNLDSIAPNGLYVRNPFNNGGVITASSNPFETFEYLEYSEDVLRPNVNGSLDYTAVQTAKHRVSFRLSGGLDNVNQYGNIFSPSFLQYEGNDGFFGRVAKTNVNTLNYNGQLVGTWGYAFQPGANLTLSGGAAYEQQRTELVRTRARGLLPGAEITSQGTQDQFNQITEFRDQALFANAQLQFWQERITLAGGVRADRSSANGDRDKFYVFPRVSGSVRFPNLGSTLSEIKLRGGWGNTGNRPNYGNRDILLAAGPIIGGSPSLTIPGALGNPTIKPENLQEIEAGTDILFANGRVQFEGTVYDRTITDLLLQPATIPSGGITNIVVNGGKLRNRGVELGLNIVPVATNAVTWNSRFMWQRNVQTIDSLDPTIPRFPVLGSFGAAFGRNFITPPVDVNGERVKPRTTWIWGNAPIVLDANGTALRTLPFGSFIVPPTLGAGETLVFRDTVVGDANPDFQMFFNNSIQLSRFTVGFTIDWRKGGDVVNLTRTLWDEGGTSRDYEDPVESGKYNNRGSDQSFDFGSLPSGYTQGSFRYDGWAGGSDARAYVEDGSYVRFRDITLSYDAPEGFARKFGARSFRVNLQARNPFVFSDYWSFDPEFNNFGATNLNRFIDLAPFPAVRQFFLSFDLGF